MKEKNETATDLVYERKNGTVNYWSNKNKLRTFFQQRYNLTDFHFQVFCAFGYSLNANPYAGEIIPIVFAKGQPNEKLSFILTRDFRGRIAQEQQDYESHFVIDVCENDQFQMNAANGFPDHTWDETTDRGRLKGAYCSVWKKGIRRPAAYVYVKYDQYKKSGKGAEVWDKLPNDMIMKVAEAHGLRQAYYNKFGNTYDSAEVSHANGVVIDIPAITEKTFEPPPGPGEIEPKPNPKKPQKKKEENLFDGEGNSSPPTEKEKSALMDNILAEMGLQTDAFLAKIKIKCTDDIKSREQFDGIKAALKEELKK